VNAGASITGTLLTLPAGPVQTAAASNIAAIPRAPSPRHRCRRAIPSIRRKARSGVVVTKEVFGELRVPLLKDFVLGRELSAQGAFRVSDYNTNGTQWSWNAGGSYTPFEGMRFRAMRSKSVRAPNIGELFSPANAGYFFGDDPCDALQVSLSPNRATNCAALGVPANYNAPTNGKTILAASVATRSSIPKRR
jgi:hypothetical protein